MTDSMPGWIVLAAALAGLIAGSFLNVVVYRGPALWGLVGADRQARGTLLGPRSRCPKCRTAIAATDLIPLAGFLLLRGRCRACGAPISWRYPLIELLGTLACLAALAAYGPKWTAMLAATYLLALVALAAIDFETGFLPEAVTLPMIALGLAVNSFSAFASMLDAAIGAGAGYAAFRGLAVVYKRIRGREGLGGGDATLFAMIGAWSGWIALAPTAFLAAALALSLICAQGLVRRERPDPAAPIAFGPYLCAAGAAVFLWSGRGFPFAP